MDLPSLPATFVLIPMAVAVLFLDNLRRRKRRNPGRQIRATLAAAASWENEGGRINLT